MKVMIKDNKMKAMMKVMLIRPWPDERRHIESNIFVLLRIYRAEKAKSHGFDWAIWVDGKKWGVKQVDINEYFRIIR